MKPFTCQKCGQLLYFENTRCEHCGSQLGFSAEHLDLLTLQLADDQQLHKYNQPEEKYHYCANYNFNACNWLVPESDEQELCFACQFNRTIPDLQENDHLKLWQKMEIAKRRLLYTLLRMKLPLTSKKQAEGAGLAFDFLADRALPSGNVERVLTGHAQGLITININEADEVQRAQMKQAMGERYRTLLGHFRHEVGHYYWDVLIANTDYLAEYRQLFGDERQDYAAALQQHYKHDPSGGWTKQFISAYASAHPWEDWAETWAHYLHIVDTLATAYAFGLQIAPRATDDETLIADIDRNPYQIKKFERIWALWLPLTIAMNSINRSMGQPDTYPFVVSEPVLNKLKFIHKVCRSEK